MMRRVVFLDVDGVLNSMSFLTHQWDVRKSRGYAENHGSADYDQSQFDPSRVALLEKLVLEVPGVEIVMSSSWRIFHLLPEIRHFIKTAGGLKASTVIIDKTPQHHDGFRGREVQAWVNEFLNEDDRFVIFDDDGDFTHQQKDSGAFIQTDDSVGLTESDIDKAKRILLA